MNIGDRVPSPLDFEPFTFDKLDDSCKNKHKGHENSVAALAAVRFSRCSIA
jgi:hypothetical protein